MKPEILQNCPQLLVDFLYYAQTIKGLSSRTVEGYYIDLRMFLRYIKATKMLGYTSFDIDEIVDISDVPTQLICSVTLSDVYAYLNYVLSQRENGSASRARKVSSLKSFYKYITTKTQYLEVSPVKDLDMPALKRALPKFLSLEESLELISSASKNASKRDYCMITLLINCGMRVSELVGINVFDIRKNDKTIRLLGKGNKERIIYINDACISAIEEYELEREKLLANSARKSENAFFLSRGVRRITSRRVEQVLEQQLALAGLSGRGYSPHKLRHTAATLMYRHGGADVRVLKEILGHENLSTTEIYTHVSSTQMQSAIESSPLANIGAKKSDNPTPIAGADNDDSKSSD